MVSFKILVFAALVGVTLSIPRRGRVPVTHNVNFGGSLLGGDSDDGSSGEDGSGSVSFSSEGGSESSGLINGAGGSDSGLLGSNSFSRSSSAVSNRSGSANSGILGSNGVSRSSGIVGASGGSEDSGVDGVGIGGLAAIPIQAVKSHLEAKQQLVNKRAGVIKGFSKLAGGNLYSIGFLGKKIQGGHSSASIFKRIASRSKPKNIGDLVETYLTSSIGAGEIIDTWVPGLGKLFSSAAIASAKINYCLGNEASQASSQGFAKICSNKFGNEWGFKVANGASSFNSAQDVIAAYGLDNGLETFKRLLTTHTKSELSDLSGSQKVVAQSIFEVFQNGRFDANYSWSKKDISFIFSRVITVLATLGSSVHPNVGPIIVDDLTEYSNGIGNEANGLNFSSFKEEIKNSIKGTNAHTWKNLISRCSDDEYTEVLENAAEDDNDDEKRGGNKNNDDQNSGDNVNEDNNNDGNNENNNNYNSYTDNIGNNNGNNGNGNRNNGNQNGDNNDEDQGSDGKKKKKGSNGKKNGQDDAKVGFTSDSVGQSSEVTVNDNRTTSVIGGNRNPLSGDDIFNIFLKGSKKNLRASSIFRSLSNRPKPNKIGDVLDAYLTSSIGAGVIIDSWAPGLGKLFSRIAVASAKANYCSKNGPFKIPANQLGNICSPKYGNQWGFKVVRESSSYDSASDYINAYGLNNGVAQFKKAMRKHIKSNFTKLSGPKRVIAQTIFELLQSGRYNSGYNWSKKDVSVVFSKMITVLASLGGSYNKNAGSTIVDGLYDYSSDIGNDSNGLKFTVQKDVIKKTIVKVDTQRWQTITKQISRTDDGSNDDSTDSEENYYSSENDDKPIQDDGDSENNGENSGDQKSKTNKPNDGDQKPKVNKPNGDDQNPKTNEPDGGDQNPNGKGNNSKDNQQSLYSLTLFWQQNKGNSRASSIFKILSTKSKPKNVGDVLDVYLSGAFGVSAIIDSWVPGLGKLFASLVFASTKINYCLDSGVYKDLSPKLQNSICSSNYASINGFDVDDDSSYSDASAYIEGYGLQNGLSTFKKLLKAHLKSDISRLSGSQKVVAQAIQECFENDRFSSDYTWTKQDISFIFSKVITIVGAVGSSYNVQFGPSIVDNLLDYSIEFGNDSNGLKLSILRQKIKTSIKDCTTQSWVIKNNNNNDNYNNTDINKYNGNQGQNGNLNGNENNTGNQNGDESAQGANSVSDYSDVKNSGSGNGNGSNGGSEGSSNSGNDDSDSNNGKRGTKSFSEHKQSQADSKSGSGSGYQGFSKKDGSETRVSGSEGKQKSAHSKKESSRSGSVDADGSRSYSEKNEDEQAASDSSFKKEQKSVKNDDGSTSEMSSSSYSSNSSSSSSISENTEYSS